MAGTLSLGRHAGHYREDHGVYVDDLVITGAKDDEVEAFKEEMKAAF